MRKNHWWTGTRLFILLALLLCFSVGAALAEETSAWDAFQQAPQRVEGHAYIELIPMMNPVRLTNAQNGSENEYWALDYWLAETNRVGFTVETHRLVHFDKDHNALMDITYAAEEVPMLYYTTQIAPGEVLLFNDAYPKNEKVAYIGVIVSGTDAAGLQMSFPMLMELSMEPVISYSMDELKNTATSEAISVESLYGSPLKLNEMEDGLWWVTEVVAVNTTEETMTLQSFDILYYNLEGQPMIQLHMEGKAAAYMCGRTTAEVGPQEEMYVCDWSPNQARSAVGLRFVLTDAQGTEHVAAMLLELSKELN